MKNLFTLSMSVITLILFVSAVIAAFIAEQGSEDKEKKDDANKLDFVVSLFSISPSNFVGLNFYLWTVFTASIFETSLIKFIFMYPLSLLAMHELETRKGTYETALYIVIVCSISGIITFFGMIANYIITREEVHVFSGIYGLGGIIVPSALAALEIVPQLHHNKLPSVKVRLIVIPGMLLYTIAFVNGMPVHDIPLMWISFFVSIVYILRQRAIASQTSNDPLSDFSFDILFPELIRPFVIAFDSMVFNSLFRICPGVAKLFILQGNALSQNGDESHQNDNFNNSSVLTAPKVVLDPVAERRRLRALQALDERLAKMMRDSEQTPTPSATTTTATAVASSEDIPQP